jgi:alpha-mannosidase II
VNHEQVLVTDHVGQAVVSQIGPVSENVVDPLGPVHMLSFIADLPPLGMAVYDIRVANNSTIGRSETAVVTVHKTKRSLQKEHIIVNNKHIQAMFSLQTGLLESLTVQHLNHTVNIDVNFLLYTSRRSGAYIFAPSGPAEALGNKRKAVVQVIKGLLFSEVRLIHPSVTHAARLVNCEGPLATVVELTNIVDMTDLDDKELIMRFDTSVRNNNVFYTDQNGFQTVKRKQFSNFPREANYYPATSAFYIEDEKSRVSIIMYQPFGVSSQKEGSLELMLDRRLLYDDNRGLGEGVIDNKPVFSRFFLLVEKAVPHLAVNHSILSAPTLLAHVLSHHLRNQPVILLSTRLANVASHFLPMQEPFLCDTVLVNLRTLTNSTRIAAALIVHRVMYDVRYSFDNSNLLLDCQTSFSDMIPSRIFKEVHIQQFIEMSLSLLHKIRNRNLHKILALEQMELYTFKVIFSSIYHDS